MQDDASIPTLCVQMNHSVVLYFDSNPCKTRSLKDCSCSGLPTDEITSFNIYLNTTAAEASPTPDLLSVLLQQREEENSDAEDSSQVEQPQASHSDGDESEEESQQQDPEQVKAEDAVVQAQLRDANEVSFSGHLFRIFGDLSGVERGKI
jgi:hypothetical protein